jgi:energy-coupling factor transport system ATP-binding protein
MSISIDSLVYRYPTGVTALDGVSLRVARGERVAIIGQNGAGKTTLVRHLNGLLRPSAGTVRIDDWDTAEHTVAQLAAKVGYVFQNPDDQLFARTVADEVRFGPRNLGYFPDRCAELLAWALGITRLTDLAELHPYQLSLAERKRVALASVLAMDTPVVVLDEPTTGQDFSGVRDIAAVLAELTARERTVLAITHDMDFCAEHFDRIIVMAQGRIVRDGAPDDVFGATDDLAHAAVQPPQMMRLSRALGWTAPVTTVDAFVDRLAEAGG